MRDYLVNFIFCFFIFFSCSSNIYATHAAGMDISFECVSQGANFDLYKITLKFYRDCSSGADAPGVGNNTGNDPILNYSSSCGSYSDPFAFTSGPVYITPNCTGSGTPCSGSSSLVELEEYTYEKIINIDKCDDWVFSVCINNRNASITTVTGADNYSLCVEAELNNLIFCNNSPTFTEYPAPYICVNESYCFNNGAIDIDGDSLVYSLVTPIGFNGGTALQYDAGFSSINPISGSTTFDPVNGNLCMNANLIQVSIVAMKISEYRNGVFIGSVIRDIQIITLSCSTVPPVLSGINGFPPNVTNSSALDDSLNLCVDEPDTISFTIDAILGSSPSKIMSWSGIPNAPNASFLITNNFSNTPSGTFNWIPQVSDIQNSPFTFNISVQDDACPINNVFTYTYTITLSSSTTFVISSTITDESCFGYRDGSIQLEVNGTDGIPTYDWIGPNGYVNINEDINSLTSGLYNVLITDISGCNLTDSFFITSPNPLQVNFNIDSVSCSGFNDGAINTTINGISSFADINWYAQTPPLLFGQWYFLSNNEDIDSLYSGTYAISVADTINGNLCVFYDTLEIIDPNPFNASFNITDISCHLGNNGAIDLSVSGNTSSLIYNWIGPNSFLSTNQDINQLFAGNYYLTITNNNGCIYNDSISLTDPLPLSSVSSISRCYSYLWNGITYTNNGTYSWTGTNANGCDSTASLNLIIYDSSSVNLSVTACDNYFWNNNLYITSGLYSWQGTNIDGCDSLVYLELLINDNQFNKVDVISCKEFNWNGVIYYQSGVYFDTLINIAGCDSLVELTLTISDFSFTTTSPICENDSTEINISILNPTSNEYNILINNYGTSYSYIVDSLGLLVSNGKTIKIKLNQDANFIFKSIDDLNNCIASPEDTSFVIVNELPSLTILLDKICNNDESFFLSQADPMGGVFYLDNEEAVVDSLYPSELSLGDHTLSYYYIDSITGCYNTTSKVIEILDAPIARMLINPQITQIDSAITFNNLSSNFVNSTWYFGDGNSFSSVSEFEYSYSEFGQYLVELSVVAQNYCIDIATNYITVYPTYSVYIPNSFSPDSDLINETFSPFGIGILSYEMTIFDRWGKVIFDKANSPWLAEGVAQGVYTYQMNIFDYNDQTYQYKGTVRVIR